MYLDSYFSSKLGKMYSFDPTFCLCCVSSQRAVPSIPVISSFHNRWFPFTSQRAHDAMITSLLRQTDVATPFWRNNQIMTPSLPRVSVGIEAVTRNTFPCHEVMTAKSKFYLGHRQLCGGLVLTLQWRHNGHDSVSNHQPYDCLLNRLFRRRSKKTSKLRVTGLCAGNSPETGEFPAQMASNAENVSIWWRHHVCR